MQVGGGGKMSAVGTGELKEGLSGIAIVQNKAS